VRLKDGLMMLMFRRTCSCFCGNAAPNGTAKFSGLFCIGGGLAVPVLWSEFSCENHRNAARYTKARKSHFLLYLDAFEDCFSNSFLILSRKFIFSSKTKNVIYKRFSLNFHC
jgi:hypothetical protein